MPGQNPFNQFAPAILKVYRRDKEAFWSAVMAPFLSNSFSLLAWMKHLRVDFGLLSAFKGLDQEAHRLLREAGQPLGLDVSEWQSNRIQYFKDAYPVFAFLAVWMDEEGLDDLVAQFGDILRAGVYAVAGYGILDANVDSNQPSPVEILMAQSLIAEYETLALNIFGVTPVNLEIMQRMRTLFLHAEIREKAARWKHSPYRLDNPENLGTKGANAVTPFMLSLERLGRADQIEDYWQVFLLFGAAIQMIDDWQDLEGDLAIGHYSYVTLGGEELYAGKDAKTAAGLLRADRQRVCDTYHTSKEMITRSRAILDKLGDRFLVRLVDVTELRVGTYFRKELGLS